MAQTRYLGQGCKEVNNEQKNVLHIFHHYSLSLFTLLKARECIVFEKEAIYFGWWIDNIQMFAQQSIEGNIFFISDPVFVVSDISDFYNFRNKDIFQGESDFYLLEHF